jgi:hypothetical protein
VGKLSDTLRGLSSHLDHFATTGINIETAALTFTKMLKAMLDGIAGTLEASPITIPGPTINPPAPTSGAQ